MPTWTALRTSEHRQLGWKRYTHYRFASQDAVAPLLFAELSHALPHYAIAFTHDQQQSYQLVVVLSLQPELNLYVGHDGRWLAPYVPSYYRSHPFRMLLNQEQQLILCFDADSELISSPADPGAIPVFTEHGELSDDLRKVVDFLQQCSANQHVTNQLVQQLVDFDLMEPWPLNLQTSTDPAVVPTSVNGLCRIREGALKELAPEKLSEIAKSGALAMAYTQLLSQVRLQNLPKLYEHRAKWQTPTPIEDLDIDALFGEHGDTIKF